VYDYIKPYCSQDHSPKAPVNVTEDDAGQHWSDSESDADDDDEDEPEEVEGDLSHADVTVSGKYELSIQMNVQKHVTCTH
jgi:hypothetical protein